MLHPRTTPFLATILLFALAVCSSFVRAQSTETDWEKAAGGKMSFDVASVKENTAGGQNNRNSNVPFYGDAYPLNGGLFSATNYWLQQYLAFAYKLSVTQSIAVDSQMPKWAQAERFDIQARAPAGTTKDQMRLMMQSLLADRFHLVAHFETKQTRAYALLLVKPGTTGPNLQPHSDDPPCPDFSAPWFSGSSLISTPKGFPTQCAGPISMLSANGAATFGGRNVNMAALADALRTVPNMEIDRPIVDQTGLAGEFDFIMKYTSRPISATNQVPDDGSPDLTGALKNQLGLKLEPITAPIETLIVDHIEQPTPN